MNGILAVTLPELATAVSIIMAAIAATYVQIRGKVQEVHTMVNSQYTELRTELRLMTQQRDDARDEVKRSGVVDHGPRYPNNPATDDAWVDPENHDFFNDEKER